MQNQNVGGQAPQLDSKNLSILEDQLKQEALCYAKCNQYAQTLTQADSKNLANRIAQTHKRHFDSLLNYLNSHQ